MLADAARWLVVPVMLCLSALMAQVAVASVDFFGRNYPRITHDVPDRSPAGTALVAISVIALIAALALAARLTQLLVERYSLRHYRRAMSLLESSATGALIADGGLWQLLSSVLDQVAQRQLIGPRPASVERQLTLAAAYLDLARPHHWATRRRLQHAIGLGARLWLAHSPPVRRAGVFSGWLMAGLGLPAVIGLSFGHPLLGILSALALAMLGLMQVSTYAQYCGNLAALCDFYRGETPDRPRIWV